MPAQPPTIAPPARREPWHRRAGRALLTWGAPLVAVGAVVLVVFAANVRDRANAERLALRELRVRLEPGERVLHRVRAAERHWYDLYRATYGVLAATDRRVLYVGVLPELYPTPDAPRAFDVRSYPYDTLFAIAATSAPFSAAAVRLSHGGEPRRYGVRAGQRAELGALVREANRRDLVIRETLRLERHYRDSLAALPPNREYYRVHRGDALESIARRYHTTPERLRALNRLADDRIRIGQELLVRVTPHPITPCPPEICGAVSASGGEIRTPEARTPNPPPR
ncbi:MAG TPA: LysM peptidoglycan-binding domain-containing protein [Gemmatimonadaceae bacterium]